MVGRVPDVVDLDGQHPLEVKRLIDEACAAGSEVLTDPSGSFLQFLTADDAEYLLTSREFGAPVAMVLLALSGVTDGPLHELWSDLMFGKDGDDHHRIRRAVSARFTPKAIEGLRPDVERISAELLAAIDPRAVTDLWDAYAVPLPARAACLLVGIPDADADLVAGLALKMVRAFGLMSDAEIVVDTERSGAAMMAYLDRLIDDDCVLPGSILADLLADDEHHLSPSEVRALCANLVFGGLDATAKALTAGLLTLRDHPHAWTALIADPGGVAPNAVSECLRYFPPSPAVGRLSTTDTELRGTPVGAYQAVIANIDAVCRDPELFDEPDAFDVARTPGRQYPFGAGVHYCLGANLAKLVLEVAFGDLAARFPAMTITADVDDLPWTADPFRGPVSLPVILDPLS
jgi:cytochrome P450